MNEHELSKLLHEAAEDVGVSSTATRRVLRRTRLRMATTGAMMLSVVVLIAGGGFALATKSTETQPKVLEPAQSRVVTAPDAPESDLVLMDDREVLLAEVQESDDRAWTFSGIEQRSGLCLNSTTHWATSASGTGDCVDLGVPEHRHIGFIELDDPERDRYEVLGTVSTDVRSLDYEDDSGEVQSVMLIDGPDKLGVGRNFFYLWLARGEEGALEARGVNEEVLQREELCLSAGVTACSVGEESTASASSPATNAATEKMMMNEMRLTCRKGERDSDRGEGEMGVTPDEALQAWLDGAGLNSGRLDQVNLNFLSEEDLDVENVGPDTRVLGLPPNGDYVIVALVTRVPAPTRSEIDQWRLGGVVFCPDLINP